MTTQEKQHMMHVAQIAAQLAASITSHLSADNQAPMPADYDWDELTEHFGGWELAMHDVATYAEHVASWAEGKRFNNWYELVDELARTYLLYRYDVRYNCNPYVLLIAEAVMQVEPEEEK